MIARHLDLGGTERQLCEMACSLDRRRFAVHVATFLPDGIRAQEIMAAGIPVVQLPLRSFKSPRSLWRTIHALRRYIKAHHIRVVHAFDPPAVLLAGVAAPFLQPAKVLSSQRCFRVIGSAVRQRLLYLADARTQGVVVNCDAVRRFRQSRERVDPPIHVCYNGLDTTRFQRLTPAPRPPGVPVGATVIGSVCGLRAEKGLDVLLRAFAVHAATRPDIFLVIVGDGRERKGLERLAGELGITDRCLMSPTAADVVPWLSVMDVFVLPSRANEALSNSLMEAMACGCACVASAVGGNPELIKDGATGLLFSPNAVDELAERLKIVLDDPSLRERLGRAARESVAAQFTLETSAARMGAIYDEVLGRPPARPVQAGSRVSRVATRPFSHDGQVTL